MVGREAFEKLAPWPSIQVQLVQLTVDLYEINPPGPLGIYVHGSLAMGCFNPARSDLDILAVVAVPLTDDQRRLLAARLLQHSSTPRPVEISVCHYAQFHPWRYPPPFDFHFSESWRPQMAAAVARGQWLRDSHSPPAVDPDLAAHCMVVRHRGLRLAGAPIAELIPAVPWDDYLDAILADVAWSADLAHADPVYQTLNLCRVWAAVADGLVLSKAEGAEWAAPRLPPALAATVAAVLAVYRGLQLETVVSAEQTAQVAVWIRQQLPVRCGVATAPPNEAPAAT